MALGAVIAAALVGNGDRLAVEFGPVSLDIGIGVALGAAGSLAVVRLGLQLGMAWPPAQISTDVQAGCRRTCSIRSGGPHGRRRPLSSRVTCKSRFACGAG